MPLIEQPWGLAALCGVMVVIAIATWKWLRGRGWL
jgi:Mg2+ and Co2+ transporter CorA